jgi:DNA-binding LytR/AlgR family response regulator
MTCIIIDDEPLARKGMELNVSSVPGLTLLGCFSNPLLANDLLRSGEVDLMFLDINMPELNGLDFFKTLKNPPLVIFATAYPQYALDSYELDAVDYLMKPVAFERFLKAVNKAESHLRMLSAEGQSRVESITSDHIFIKADRKFFKLFFNEILFIEGLKDYVIIHTADKKVITAMNVKTIAAQLPSQLFARVSKSYIVNIAHITSFDSEIINISQHEVPIGANFRDDFLKNYVNGKLISRQG